MVFDPSAAVSLAAAVIQFVDFGAKLIAKSQEIYESADGVLADYAEQAAVSSRLLDLNKGLLQAHNASATLREVSPAEHALRDIAVECATQADEFADAIDQLKVGGNHRRWKSFRQAVKSVWSKRDINARLARLNRLRQEVVIHLLVCVNETQARAVAQNHEKLEHAARKVIDEIQETRASLKDQIRDLAEAQDKVAKEHPRQRHKSELEQMMVSQLLATIISKEGTENFALRKIDDRQNMIDKKHQATLEWIYRSPPELRSHWCELPAWLEGPIGIYWVSGKAGSGKSTLMKWIFSENRTTQRLKAWSGSRKLLIASFFFWAPGNDAQTSLAGLLRSLPYDLLRQSPESVCSVLPARWQYYDLELEHFPAWSHQDLLAALRMFIKSVSKSVCVSLFIDGLDEFLGDDEERSELVAFLKEIALHSTVKICVSSRPWELFKSAFAGYPHLRLEYLTRQDIADTVNSRLQSSEKFRSLQERDSDSSDELVSEITEKAQGVWLWVILVIRNLLNGLRNLDTVAKLRLRLRQIPAKLSSLFLQMLNSVEEVYRLETLMLLKIALHCPELTLMTSSFVYDYDPNVKLEEDFRILTTDEAVLRLDDTVHHMNLRCLGLLEVAGQNTDGHLYYQKSVDFLHSTARDVLFKPATQRQIGMEGVAEFDVNLYMCRAFLAQINMSESPPKMLLADFMLHAVSLEDKESGLLTQLLVDLNKTLETRHDHLWGADQIEPSKIKGWWTHHSRPHPLLPLAIQYGLSTYSRRVLQSNPKLATSFLSRPLLDYALRRNVYSLNVGQAEQLDGVIDQGDKPDVEVVRLILMQGGDPNATCGDSTVWKLFMQFFDTFADSLRRVSESDRKVWIEVTELLIKYGATRLLDQHTIMPHQSCGRTRVRLTKRQVWAKASINVAFGVEEAERLDSMAWQLEVTGQTLFKKLKRTLTI
ncbi:MAG: hypothetical protein Q9160_006691 [Pyrenula sp. 1 TL-2023]